ncbi:uncharacterized protein LOC119986913 [Tripterygium wilfordii]|uniref:uncharacterized protein LOC119986913 n=1 Tax=Tripterygium wilfordii TaxID=458696 RepID=UPI0018F84936|nr:uncharacterized protein LOC119986913 [Tripterygium wilfordii]
MVFSPVWSFPYKSCVYRLFYLSSISFWFVDSSEGMIMGSAFVKGRLITDNVLIAFEVMHHLQTKCVGAERYMALKLDMTKAYDRVEWSFLEAVMIKMGFAGRWVEMILECLKSVKYSVLINGSLKGSWSPKRGLRQGDPLSPYLFIICAEALSKMLEKAHNDKVFQGVKVARGAPRINHLFFTDDSLLFCRASGEECSRVLEVIHNYEVISGQLVNIHKSNVFFSRNTPALIIDSIKGILGVSEAKMHERYLGLPTVIGKSKREIFSYIRDRVSHRIHDWNGKLLSRGGKEILLKSIVQAIPSYAMSCFKLPKSTTRWIMKRMAGFWWGSKEGQQRMHWAGWDTLTKSKDNAFGQKYLEISDKPKLFGCQIWLQGVNSLIAENSNRWNEVRVRSLFMPFELDLILSIPLPYEPVQDSMIWNWEPNGRYTVKTVKNAIPTHSNLINRHVGSHSLCLGYGGPFEDVDHVFRKCIVAGRLWRELSPCVAFELGQGLSFIDWVVAVLQSGKRDTKILFATVIWVLWGSRNSVLHDGQLHHENLNYKVKIFVAEFMEHCGGSRSPSNQQANGVESS